MALGRGKGGDDMDAACFGAGVFCWIFFIIMLSLFGTSFNVIGSLEYGVDYNPNSYYLNNITVYGPGRWVFGVGHIPVIYPASYEFVEFTNETSSSNSTSDDDDLDINRAPLSVFTKDGIVITLECSYQFKLIAQELPSMYVRLGKNWRTYYGRIGEGVIKSAASFFTVQDYFERRVFIGQFMVASLQVAFQDHNADIAFFQLRKISLPDTVEAGINSKIVALQAQNTAKNLQQIAQIEAETNVINSQADQQIVAINAIASAQAFQIIQSAVAKALQLQVLPAANTYSQLAQRLNFTTDELLRYQWQRVLTHLETGQLLVNVGEAKINA